MDIPQELDDFRYDRRLSELGCGKVIKLKGSAPFASDKYHIFLVLGRSNENRSVAMAVNGTTQYAKRLAFHKRIQTNDDPLVLIRADKYSFFPKETCIDCSQVSVLDLDSLDRNNIEFLEDEFSKDDLADIIRRVLSSDLVSPMIKQLIRSNVDV